MKEVHVLNHTHWDREWYETFEEFRYKLRNGLRYVQSLLESGRLENFFLDGQTIVLDDYREVVSKEEYERLASYIKAGKIEVGPWYLLADEFLVSGESILKNLEIGIQTAKAHGSAHGIGYLPDTFGHASQMPQIFKGYNINTAIVWRGAVSDTFENTWEGADGSEVFTFVLPLMEGYYQTFLKHDDFIEKAKDYLNRNEPYLTFGKALVMNGADHTYTCADLNERLERLQESIPDVTVHQSLMSEYMEAFVGAEPTGRIIGEQRDPSKIFILPGVYSTRSYLKQQNQLCEDQAVSVMEALHVWTDGNTDSEQFLAYVWKLILQNQPHDSICGCSVDEVHEEMETRTKKVLGAIRQFAKDTLQTEYPFEYLNETMENPFLYVINNTPIAGMYPVKARIMIPATLDTGSIRLVHEGVSIPFDMISRVQREEFLRHILAEPHYGEYVVYDVMFNLSFTGVETKRVQIERISEEVNRTIGAGGTDIQNEFYRITWSDDSLEITDLESDTVYENQHVFLSSLDAGDTYNYSPPVHDVETKATIKKVGDVMKGRTYQSVTLYYEMKIPASLNEERTGPSNEYVVNTMETEIRLYTNKRMIYFHTKVNNAAKDQKLRIGFACSQADVSYSDTAFDLVRRDTRREKQWDMPKNKEAVMNQYPTYSTVIANEHQLVHRGMQEYEVDRAFDQDYVFLTMIRSVGWLSRRDLRTRGNGAGPGFETPGAQCLGTYEFQYGLILGKEHMSLNYAKMLRNEVLVQQSYEMRDEKKLFSQSSTAIAFSAFMRKKQHSMDIRMFNSFTKQQTTELHFGFTPISIEEVDFTGITQAVYDATKQIVVNFKPKQIKTIRVTWKEQE